MGHRSCRGLKSISLSLLLAALAACAADVADPVASRDEEVDSVGQPLLIAIERGHALVNADGSFFRLPDYAFNGVAGTITSTHPGTGRYRVVFGGLRSFAGNAQVVAFGTGPERCNPSGWGVLPETNSTFIDVLCWRGAQPADSAFVVLYDNDLRRPAQAGSGAFLLSTNGGASGPAEPTWSFNPTGRPNTIQRVTTGTYFAHLPGLLDGTGNAQVTAFGVTSNFCQPTGWLASGSETLVGVFCWNAAGQLADTPFSLRYSMHERANEQASRSFAALERPTAASYQPDISYQRNDLAINTAYASVARSGTGRYRMSIPQMPHFARSAALVTAINDTSPRFCKPTGWGPGPGPQSTILDIVCFDAAGRATDTEVSQLFFHHQDTCLTPFCQIPERLVHPGALRFEDNPKLTGYVRPSRFSTRTLENNWNFQTGFPGSSSGETYGGSTGLVLRSNVPVFAGPMLQSSSVLVRPSSGSAVTFRQQTFSRMPPWVFFDVNCNSPSCPLPPTVPFFSSPILLPADHSPVSIDMVLEPGDRAIPELPTNGFPLQLDPAITVIPVHAYVMLDSTGRPGPSYDIRFKESQTAVTTFLRQAFDHAFATNPAPATMRNTSAKTVMEKASLTMSPITPPSSVAFSATDTAFHPCLAVQFRLESVSFVRQNLGLERALMTRLEDINSRTSCNVAAESFARSLRDSAEASMKRGLHIVLGGFIGENTTTGIACESDRIALVSAAGIPGQTTYSQQTTSHEIGHLLGLTQQDEAGNLMREMNGGTALTVGQCTTVKQKVASSWR